LLEDNMSDEFQQKPGDEIQQDAVADVKPTEELSPEALSGVNGGAVVKTVDKSSPVLFTVCAQGKHYT
jgi:type VI protein secretion system component Hcp